MNDYFLLLHTLIAISANGLIFVHCHQPSTPIALLMQNATVLPLKPFLL